MATLLSYVEHALPGATLAERLDFAREQHLALEVAHRSETDWDAIADSSLEVATVQAWEMHDHHPLHSDPDRVRRGRRHVFASMETAARLGTRRVLTVCGFGTFAPDEPLERCVEFFAPLGHRARELGLKLLIEPLSSHRAAAMSSPELVAELLLALDDSEVFAAALDTGHLLDDGRDPVQVLNAWSHPLDEVQIRALGGVAPRPDAAVEAWVSAAVPRTDVICIEHYGNLARIDAVALIERVRSALS